MKIKITTNIVSALFFFLLFSIVGCTSNSNTQQPTTNPQQETNTPKPNSNNKTILFFGNSLTAGYGLDQKQAFPALIQEKINAINKPYTVINAGVSGETTAGGLGRIDWMLRNKVDVFILELGGNDGLRGIKTTATKQNLQGIITKVQTKYPDCKIVLAGMEAPPNLGKKFTTDFRNVFISLAKENKITYLPFLLDKVAGETNLNLPDGIHPNIEGQKIVASNVWNVLKGLL